MLTGRELLYSIGVPVAVSVLISLLGFWRRWAWAMPVAAGAGFLAGYYALSGVPRLPPRDGTDWLFWAALPVTGLGVLDAALPRRWGWVLGAAAGGVALLIGWSLVQNNTIPAAELCGVALIAAVVGAGLSLVVRLAEPRLGTPAVVAALCVTIGAAGLVVLSSHQRVSGVYGIAASAALGPVAVFTGRVRAARSVAIVALALLAGLLTGGHYYADPGVGWTHAGILMFAPALLLPCVALPGRRNWLRGIVAVALVAIAVGAVAVPTALAAKKAAEVDPYGAYSE
jgi:hypothetical protein